MTIECCECGNEIEYTARVDEDYYYNGVKVGYIDLCGEGEQFCPSCETDAFGPRDE